VDGPRGGLFVALRGPRWPGLALSAPHALDRRDVGLLCPARAAFFAGFGHRERGDRDRECSLNSLSQFWGSLQLPISSHLRLVKFLRTSSANRSKQLETHLNERTAEIVKEIDARKKQALAEIQIALDEALKKLKDK
jgi:hypothetical protein